MRRGAEHEAAVRWPVGRQACLPLLALVLALIVFVPDVSLAGSWASPASVAQTAGGSEDGQAPAQLVRPTAPTAPLSTPLVLLVAVAVAAWVGSPWLVVAARITGRRDVPLAPGRRGRTVLQAFLN